jgi:hypothetical protein
VVTIKDMGDVVELAVLLPVEQKTLGEGISKTGFDYKDIKSYGFVVRMRTADYVSFIEDTMNGFSAFQLARAQIFKTELDAADLH